MHLSTCATVHPVEIRDILASTDQGTLVKLKINWTNKILQIRTAEEDANYHYMDAALGS